MRLLQIAAFLNELNFKSATMVLKVLKVTSDRKVALSKQYVFLHFALVIIYFHLFD